MDFKFKLMNYKSKTGLPEGYEYGHICGKYYENGNILNDITLANDLLELIGVYRELQGKLIDKSIEKTNNFIIANYNQKYVLDTQSDSEIDKILVNENIQSSLTQTQISEIQLKSDFDDNSSTPRKANYEKKNKN